MEMEARQEFFPFLPLPPLTLFLSFHHRLTRTKTDIPSLQITVEPGLIGGEVNRILAAYKTKNKLPIQYKIGPDPSSIDSCMIGGIVSNNSSGMCCGVSQNTYHTLKDMRIVLVDGTVLDTADPVSCESFLRSHKALADGVVALASKVQADRQLTALIRRLVTQV